MRGVPGAFCDLKYSGPFPLRPWHLHPSTTPAPAMSWSKRQPRSRHSKPRRCCMHSDARLPFEAPHALPRGRMSDRGRRINYMQWCCSLMGLTGLRGGLGRGSPGRRICKDGGRESSVEERKEGRDEMNHDAIFPVVPAGSSTLWPYSGVGPRARGPRVPARRSWVWRAASC